jgi:hypothetical protein
MLRQLSAISFSRRTSNQNDSRVRCYLAVRLCQVVACSILKLRGTRPSGLGRDSTWAEHRTSRAAGESSRSTSHGWRRTSERSFTDFSVVETELGVVCTSFRGAKRDFRRGVTGFRGMKRGFRGAKSDFRAALSDFSVMETCFRPMKSNFRTIDQRLLSGRK